MSDQNLLDDPLGLFDQPLQTIQTKPKSNEAYENRLFDDIDPFGNYNGQENHNNHNEFSFTNDSFPIQTNENDKVFHVDNENKQTQDSLSNILSQLNGSLTDKNTLLFDIDPDASNIETKPSNDTNKETTNVETLLDFDGLKINEQQQQQEFTLTSFHNPTFDLKLSNDNEIFPPPPPPPVPQTNEQDLLKEAYEEVDNAAQELVTKIDQMTTPVEEKPKPTFPTNEATVENTQTATSPKPKQPTVSTTRSTNVTKNKTTTTTTSKSTDHKSTASAVVSKSTEHKPTTTKSTESKPSTTVRKTIHSAPPTTTTTTTTATVTNKSKVTLTSPTPEKSTRDVPTKPSTTVKPKTTTTTTIRSVTKTNHASTTPKSPDVTSPKDQQTILSTAPGNSPSASALPPTRSSVRSIPLTTKTASSTTTRTSIATTTVKERPTSHSRITGTRPSTATGGSTTIPLKRSNSAKRPSTGESTRSSVGETASGTTITKTHYSSTTSKIGSLQNTTHKPGGGVFKIQNNKLQWNAKSKIGSLENAHHKPGGGSIKIENKKLDFKEKAKPRTDCGVHEVMTSASGGGDLDTNTSGTVNEENHKDDETSVEIIETQNKQ